MNQPQFPQLSLIIRVLRLRHGQGLALPSYQSAAASGLDLLAAVPDGKPVELTPGGRALVPTGIALELTPGFEGQIRPRSGLAHKHGVTVLNSPGTIDADYRGEIMVLLANLGTETFRVHRGERIAQLVVAPVAHVSIVPVEELGGTRRGTGGFGSTG
jgi:dUTP pyrophosphatase